MALSKETNTKAQLDILDEQMRTIPVSMRGFTLAMRSLYAETAVGSGSGTALKVNELRDDTRQDAMTYLKGVLPLSTSLVRSIREFFEYYEELALEEWGESLPDIIEDVKGYKQCCIEVVKLHERIMIPLKSRQDEAKVLVSEFSELGAEYNRKSSELAKSASLKMNWAIGLAFVPGVNLIAYPMLKSYSQTDLAESIAKGVQCKIYNSAAIVVDKTLIPALSEFIDGLNAIAGFFSVMEQEMESFLHKGDKAIESKKSTHYKMVRLKAKAIGNSCKTFYAMIPEVRTDLLSIPSSDTDDNYVDKWLKKQREEIEKKYRGFIRGQLKMLLSHLTGRGGQELMLEFQDEQAQPIDPNPRDDS